MAQEADSVVGVVAQHVTGAHLGPMLCNDLPCAGVLHRKPNLLHVREADSQSLWMSYASGSLVLVGNITWVHFRYLKRRHVLVFLQLRQAWAVGCSG